MTISFIFISLGLMFLLLVLAFALENYPLGMLSSLGIIIIGVYISIYNVEHINNMLTQTFAIISIGLGAYVFINGSVEKIQDMI